jgi:hypothetical protein
VDEIAEAAAWTVDAETVVGQFPSGIRRPECIDLGRGELTQDGQPVGDGVIEKTISLRCLRWGSPAVFRLSMASSNAAGVIVYSWLTRSNQEGRDSSVSGRGHIGHAQAFIVRRALFAVAR